MDENIRVESRSAVLTVTMDRPAKKNALTMAMYAALDEALAAAAHDERVSVVVIRAAGDAFSAGNDISDFLQRATSTEPGGVLPAHRFLRGLASFPKPLMAAVNGLAVGIGATMLLHCDFVVASSGATFQFPFTRLGLVPEAASSVLLPARVGLQRASEWLLLGERIDAATALAAGLVNAVVAPERLAEEVAARAEAFARLPLAALVATKRLVREPMRDAVEQALERELVSFNLRLRSPEATAAFSAFLAKGK